MDIKDRELELLNQIETLENRIKFLESELQACENKAKHFALQKDIFVNKYRFLVRDLKKIIKDE